MDKKLDEFLRQAAKVGMTEDESLRVRKMVEEKMSKNAVRAADGSCLTDDMTEISPSFIAAAKALRLSQKEAQTAQKRLHAFMDAHPVNMAKAMHRKEQMQGGWVSMRSLFSLRYGPILAAVLLLVGAGGGISYAAESALPGDPLYGVKVHVNEAVKASLAFTPQAKASVNAQIAAERINEAEALAAKGKLTTDTNASLIAAFQAHVDTARTAIDDVAKEGNAQVATTLNADMQKLLEDHTALLHSLEQKDDGSTSHSEIAVVLQNVEDATQQTIAFKKSLDGDGQIALNVALPFAATNSETSGSDGSHQNGRMMQVEINQKTEEHHDVSSSDDQGNSHTEVHISNGTNVRVFNTMNINVSGSGAVSSGSGSSSMKTDESSSNGTSVHIEQNGSVQINTSTTTNATNDVHIEQSDH